MLVVGLAELGPRAPHMRNISGADNVDKQRKCWYAWHCMPLNQTSKIQLYSFNGKHWVLVKINYSTECLK